MFTCIRLTRRRVPSWQTHLSLTRYNSSPASDSSVDNDTSTALDSLSEQLDDAADDQESSQPTSYNQFLDTIGKKFKDASTRNWLGGRVPFPMNPSFSPPIPLPDALRTKIYREFMGNPEENSVRALSQKYHISLKRIDAILRLKGLENAWVKGKELQTGFQQGMEKLLGVEDQKIKDLEQDQDDLTRRDVHEADILEQEEGQDTIRQRYQRLYWESIPDSRGEPIVPGVLELAKQRARQWTERAEGIETSRMTPIKDIEYIKTPQKKVQVVTRAGRPTFVFQDVGSKFIDREEQLYRTVVAQRRARGERGRGRP